MTVRSTVSHAACIATLAVCSPIVAQDDEAATLFPVPNYARDIWSRPAMTGDWGGARRRLADNGIQFELDLVQTYQGVLDGGLDSSFRYTGNLDYVLTIDGQKAGLWEGLFILLRGETTFDSGSANGRTGAVLAVNSDALFPVAGMDVTTLTDFAVTQFLSESAAIVIGKISTLDGDMNEFAHGRGTDQFMNLAHIANPVTFRTTPYSALGVGFVLLPTETSQLTVMALDAEGTANRSGFDTVFDGGTTLSAEFRTAVEIGGNPGHQLIGVTWSTRDYVSLVQDPRLILNLLPGVMIPATRSSGSWSVYYNFDQYLWMEEESGRGFGLFGRLGFADDVTNPIEFFASIGVGGQGLLPGRDNDTYGVGYYYAAGSDKLPGIFTADDDGQGLELFYNIEVTPWFHVTPDIQIIDPGATGADTAIVAGVRCKIEF